MCGLLARRAFCCPVTVSVLLGCADVEVDLGGDDDDDDDDDEEEEDEEEEEPAPAPPPKPVAPPPVAPVRTAPVASALCTLCMPWFKIFVRACMHTAAT